MDEKTKRGFALWAPEKQREAAKKGGRSAHAKGTAHQFTSEEARVAGRKGGAAVSQNREHMSRIGAIGGGKSRRSGIRDKASGSDEADFDRDEQ